MPDVVSFVGRISRLKILLHYISKLSHAPNFIVVRFAQDKFAVKRDEQDGLGPIGLYLFIPRKLLEYVCFILSCKPVALCRSTVYCDNSVLTAVVRNLRHSNRLAILLDNVVTHIACNAVEINRIVDAIADYGIPSNT